MEGHFPLALSALDKAETPPAGTKEVRLVLYNCDINKK